MNKRIIAIYMAFTMIFSTLFACTNTQTNNVEKITSETPYYYVTNGAIIKERNHYMEVEVKMPRIKYYNKETDPVFDPINEEIENTITKIVDESKNNAYETYMTYLESAKANVENEKALKIQALKEKYKSILTDDEVKALRSLEDEEIFNIATESFLNVDGFSSTEDILNEGPHNKKIIVIDNTKHETPIEETTKSSDDNSKLRQATVKIEGKPGAKPTVAPKAVSKKEVVSSAKAETKKAETKKAEIENTETKKAEIDANVTKLDEKTDIVEDAEVNGDNEYNDKPPFQKRFGKRIASMSEFDYDFTITDEITLENFYKELKMIKRLRVPNDRMLTFGYMPTYIYCDFDVKCLDEDYISLYINFYETRTQTASKVLFYNIDLKNKKLLSIKDILGDNFKETCLKSINNTIENFTEDKKALLSSKYNIEDFINEDTTFFINNNHMPVVVFDKYAIAAGAAGYPEFQIIK